MTLIPIVVKKSKINNTFKYWGGLLNPNKQYYTRRVTSKVNPLQHLKDMMK